MPPTLLLTRPLAQSRGFLADCTAALGHAPAAVIAPLVEIRPTGAELPPGDLVLTSGRAAEAAGDLTGRRAWCVGDRTADLARRAGAESVSAKGDQTALLTLLLDRRPTPLVVLHGSHRRGGLAEALRAAGLPVHEVAVYASRDLPPGAEALALLAGAKPVLAPVFSPRMAALLAAVPARAPLTVVAISAAAAAPFRGRAEVEVAPRPDGRAMLEVVLRRLRNLS